MEKIVNIKYSIDLKWENKFDGSSDSKSETHTLTNRTNLEFERDV